METQLATLEASTRTATRRSRNRQLAPLIFNHRADDLIQIEMRLEPNRLANLVELGDTTRKIVEILPVGLLIRNVLNRTFRAGDRDHAPGEIVDRNLIVAAKVEDVAESTRRVDRF